MCKTKRSFNAKEEIIILKKIMNFKINERKKTFNMVEKRIFFNDEGRIIIFN